MKALRIIGIIVVILLLIPLFMPNELTLSRSIVINQSQNIVYEHVHNFNHYINWNPWSPKEPSAEMIVSENGDRYDWKGTIDGIGIGHLTHDIAEEYSAIENDMVFETPMAVSARDIWIFEESDEGTRVTWSFLSKMDYPMNLFQPFIQSGIDTDLGPDFEQGLKNLKAMTEAYEAPVDSTMMDDDESNED